MQHFDLGEILDLETCLEDKIDSLNKLIVTAHDMPNLEIGIKHLQYRVNRLDSLRIKVSEMKSDLQFEDGDGLNFKKQLPDG